MASIFKTELCPVCDKETNAFKKSGAKADGKFICTNCYKLIINSGINALDIKKKSLKDLKQAAGLIQGPSKTEEELFRTTPSPVPKSKTEKKPIDDLSIPVIDFNGETVTFPWYMAIKDGKSCLVTKDGKTYHTHISCFKKWPKEYQESFTEWIAMTITDAEAKGMKKCSFCEEADNAPEPKHEMWAGWDEFKNDTPLEDFTISIKDSYDLEVGSEISTSYDYDDDQLVLSLDCDVTVKIPEDIREYLEGLDCLYKLFVTKKSKTKATIGIYRDD